MSWTLLKKEDCQTQTQLEAEGLCEL